MKPGRIHKALCRIQAVQRPGEPISPHDVELTEDEAREMESLGLIEIGDNLTEPVGQQVAILGTSARGRARMLARRGWIERASVHILPVPIRERIFPWLVKTLWGIGGWAVGHCTAGKSPQEVWHVIQSWWPW